MATTGLYFGRHWLLQNYYRQKVERTFTNELKPLKGSLTALGYKDLSNLDTRCGYITYKSDPADPLDEPIRPNGTYLECSSGINRLTKVPEDAAGKITFNQRAVELSKVLQANGWQSRKDYPTVPWFQKISEGVDYQPDQLNQKTVNNMQCTVDFFTAFSKPDPIAISVMAFCVKPQ